MIFNWYDNSEKIFQTKKLKQDDNRDKKSFYLQELYYVRYLLSLDYNQEQCFNEWKMIKSSSAETFSYDDEQQEVIFQKIYQKAVKLGKLERLDCNCVIFQEEIDFLNKLQAPLWVRQYWLGVLVWYKCLKRKYFFPEIDIKWFSWILKQCENNYQYKRKSEVLSQWNRQCKRPVALYSYNEKVYVKITWSKDEGKEVAKDITLENFTELFPLLEKETFICPRCHGKYERSLSTKKDVCDKCYKEQIRLVDRERKRKVSRG